MAANENGCSPSARVDQAAADRPVLGSVKNGHKGSMTRGGQIAREAEGKWEKRLPVHVIEKGFSERSVSRKDAENAKIEEVVNVLLQLTGKSIRDSMPYLALNIDRLRELDAKDSIESMLAAQIVTTHAAALRALELAVRHDELPLARERHMKDFEKLVKINTSLIAALDKRRGNGQQKIIVERVDVQSGGQAIVGNVHAASPRVESPDQPGAQQALGHEAGRNREPLGTTKRGASGQKRRRSAS